MPGYHRSKSKEESTGVLTFRQKEWGGGENSDLPASVIAPNEVPLLQDMVAFDGYLEGHSGSVRYSATALPGGGLTALGAMGSPAALHLEMQPPPAAVARSLRLSAGQSAAKVTVRFDDQATGRPAALTIAVLRPELFRIVVQTAEMPLPGGEAGSATGAWARTTEGCGS